jgi:NhaP-type Na+/H+ and K+/H+ antiporter
VTAPARARRRASVRFRYADDRARQPAVQVSDLPVGEDTWISFIIRNGRLVPIRSDTVLQAGDEVVVLSTDPEAAGLAALFTAPSPVHQAEPPQDSSDSALTSGAMARG